MVAVALNMEHGICPPFFVRIGCKINADYYQNECLENHFLPNIQSIANGKDWIWQQDGASAHTSGQVTNFLNKNLGAKRWIKNWPPSSPDCSPLDYFLWGHVEPKIADMAPKTIPELKACIVQALNSVDRDAIRKAVAQVPERLQRLIDNEGTAFEHQMRKK